MLLDYDISENNTPIWVPDNGNRTRIHDFINHVNELHNLSLKSYQELWKWSVDDISGFWRTFLNYSGIKYHGSAEEVIDEKIPMQNIPKWFPNLMLNYAENLLKRKNHTVAVIAEDESGSRTVLSKDQLYCEVSKLHHQFKRFGLTKGDIVASCLPNDHRAIIAMLACASLGCVFTSMPTELQAKGIIQKLNGIRPRILLAPKSITYAGKTYEQLPKLKELAKELTYLEAIVIFVTEETDMGQDKFMSHYQFEKKYGKSQDCETSIDFVHVPFCHPLFILYTSGTTGPSKKLVHSVGGTLIKVVMEHMINGDMRETDVMLYNTSPGWIMWNWMVTSLFVGGAVVVYDGSPLKPDPYVLFSICDRNKVTVFGAGAAYYYAIEQNNVIPNSRFNLASLRYFLSTGSYLPKASYYFINQKIRDGVPICSIAGATDIISCFAGHNLTLPVYPGEIQYSNLGMLVQCFDESGNAIVNKFGELVCTKPFPSMPVYFMNDPDNTRYIDTYFSKFPGVWTHGDYCMINSRTGGLIISGRSDSTLNVNGVRIGTSEIYNIVQQIPGVIDSLCVCQELGSGKERMVLFVSHDVSQDNFDILVAKIKEQILCCLSPRHMPSLILPAPHIPYTITGKKVEILVKKIISKKTYSINHESLKDPSQLEYFINYSF